MQRVVDYSMRDNYKDCLKKSKKDNPELYKYLKNMGFNAFKAQIKSINEAAAQYVIDNPIGIKFPLGIGQFRIFKRRTSFSKAIEKVDIFDVKKLNGKYKYVINKMTDWKATRKLQIGKRIIHANDHSNGYKFIWVWDKSKTRCPHKNLYFIIMERKHNRQLAKNIFAGKQNYGILSPRNLKRTNLIMK